MEAGARRLEKRRKRKKLLKRLRFLTIIIVILIIVYQLLTRLPYFGIENFAVTGNKQVNDNDLVINSGLVKGENIFKINKSKAEENVLKEPYIESVKLNRVLPDTVGIEVKEKNDKFIVENNGKNIYLGKKGEVLSVLDNKKKVDVPLIEGLTVEKAEVLKSLKLKDKKINTDEFSAFIKGASNNEVYKLIDKIVIEGDNQVIIEAKNGAKIVFGKLDNSEYKMRFLVEVLKDINKKKVKFKLIDFTKSKRVVVEKMTQQDIEELEELKDKEKEEAESEPVEETPDNTEEEPTTNEESAEEENPEQQDIAPEQTNQEEEVPEHTLQDYSETHMD